MKKMMKLFVVSAMAVSMFAGSAFANTTTPATPATTTTPATPATTTPATTPATPATPATTTPATTTPATTTTTPATTTTTTPATTTPATPAAEPKTAQEKFDVLKGKGIFTGLEDGSAGLDQDMTRAQAAAIVARLLGLKEDAAASSVYKDLTDAKWAAGFIGAVTPKYMQGVGSGKFDPSGKITIEQLATVMVRVLGLKIDEKATVVGASAWAQPYVSAALAAKLMAELPDYKKPAKRELLVETSYGAYVVVSKPVVPPAPPVSLEVDSVSSYSQTLVAVEMKAEQKAAPDVKEFKVKDDAGKDVAVSAAALKNGGKLVVLKVAELASGKRATLTFGGKDYPFNVRPNSTVKPLVSAVTATMKTEVKVTYNTDMDDNALTITNYAIPGLKVNSAKFEQASVGKLNRKVVLLTVDAQTASQIYNLTINNVESLIGNAIAPNTLNPFLGVNDTTKPKVDTSVSNFTENTNTSIEVPFSEDLDETTIQKIENYSISPALKVIAAAFKVNAEGVADKKRVVLTTDPQTVQIYTVTITNVADLSGNTIDTANNKLSYLGQGPDTTKPTISSVNSESNTSVKLVFDGKVKKELAEVATNYSISPSLAVTAAKLGADGKTVTLTTAAQTGGTTYTITVINVADIAGNVIGGTGNTGFFLGQAVDTTAPKVTKVTVISSKSIEVEFDDSLDVATASDWANYQIDNGIGYPSSVAEKSGSAGKTWVLTLSKDLCKTIYSVTVANVKNATGIAIGTSDNKRTAEPLSNFAVCVATAPKLVSASATSLKDLVLTFDQKMNETTLSAGNIAFEPTLGSTDLHEFVKLSSDGKTAYLTLKTVNNIKPKFSINTVYKVNLTSGTNGVKNADGAEIDANAKTAQFGVPSSLSDGEAVKATRVDTIDKKTIKITFNEPIDVTLTGLSENDFIIKNAGGTNISSTLGLLVDERLNDAKTELTLFFQNVIACNDICSLEFNSTLLTKIKDLHQEETLVQIATDANKFGNNNSTTSADLKVVSVQNLEKFTYDILLNKEAKFDSSITTNFFDLIATIKLSSNSNITIPKTQLNYAKISDDKKNLRLFFKADTAFTANAIYDIELDKSKLLSLNGDPLTDNKASIGVIESIIKPKMVSAKAVDAKTVDVTFSEELKAGTTFALTEFKVALAGSTSFVNPATATLQTDKKVVRLTVTVDQTPAKLYSIELVNATFKDEADVDVVDSATKIEYLSF